MTRPGILFLAACAVAAAHVAAQPQPAVPASRGELLYTTHCIACHTSQIHWRQRKLATDWASLDVQVRRWARNARLGWSDEEILDVARYLNATFYRYETPSATRVGHGGFENHVARAD